MVPTEPPHDRIDAASARAAGATWQTSETVLVVVAVVVLVGSTAAATRGVGELEADLFGAVNRGPESLLPVVWPIMQLGTVAVAVVAGVAIGMVLRSRRLAVTFAVAPIAAWVAAKGIKAAVQRGRPADELADVVIRGPIAEGMATFVFNDGSGGFGYVSGHTAVAVALATVVSPHLRGAWRTVPFVLAAVVGTSRLYVGVHLPFDVLGGAAVGVLVGEVVRAAEVIGPARRRGTVRHRSDGR